MATDYGKRRKALLDRTEAESFLVFDLDRIMPSGIDRVNLRYLTGYTGEGALLVTRDKATLFTDSRYLEQAEKEAPEIPLRHAEDDYVAEIAAAVKESDTQSLGFGAWRMTQYVADRLWEATGIELVADEDPVRLMRAVKEPSEVACIREATEASERALARLVEELAPGINEVEVAFRFGLLMREEGSERVSFEMTVASGENSSLPHYRPSLGRRTLQEGDFLLCDFGAVVGGYVSDMTRTFVVGKATDKQREIYDWVRRATDVGLDALRPGVLASDVHRASSAVIEGSPYKEHIFLSPVGHGVGLEVHELPRMGLDRGIRLEPGMVVTMEPGIYIPGYGGVRIEDLAVVTEDGFELLTSYPRDELIEIG